jgi:hypothetical protein
MTQPPKVLRDAVAYLISSDSARSEITALLRLVDEYPELPKKFDGHLEVLNPLILIGVADKPSLDKILEFVANNRAATPKDTRNDYQRDIMADRRRRMYKAIDLHEITTGRRLRGVERKQYGRDAHARWMKALEAKLEEFRGEDYFTKHLIRKQFWERIEKQLDENIAAAKLRRGSAGPSM